MLFNFVVIRPNSTIKQYNRNYTKSTKGGMRFCTFASKIQILSKKSATKFLCVKTSSGKVVATSFPYPTVHRSIAGDVPMYLKLALKVTHSFRKRRLWQISIYRAAAVRASEKVQLLLIGSRQRAFHRAIGEPRALPLSPPKGSSKRKF